MGICLVCRNFSSLVGSSSLLMRNFVIHFNQYQIDRISCTHLSRKYQSIKLSGTVEAKILIRKNSKIFKFIDSLRLNLKSLVIHHCKIDLPDFVKLLNIAEKLEYLDVSDIKYSYICDFYEYVDCPNLKHLTLDWGLLKYQMFNNYESLLKVTFSEFYDSNVRIHQIRDFLLQQKNLQEFYFKNRLENQIFDKRFCDKVEFKLKSIDFGILRNCKMIPQFLDTQNELEEVELFLQKTSDQEMVETLMTIFNTLENLKKLVLNLECFLNVNMNGLVYPSMEEFNLRIFGCYEEHKHLRIWENLTTVMPNLKKICFRQCYAAKDDHLLFLNRFKLLEHLEIEGWCRVRGLTYFRCNRLKTVKLEIMDRNINESDWALFFTNSPKISEIHLSGFVFSKSLWNFIRINLKDLTLISFTKLNKSLEMETLRKYVETSKDFVVELKPPKFGSYEMIIKRL